MNKIAKLPNLASPFGSATSALKSLPMGLKTPLAGLKQKVETNLTNLGSVGPVLKTAAILLVATKLAMEDAKNSIDNNTFNKYYNEIKTHLDALNQLEIY